MLTDPAVLGAPGTTRRVNSAGTALEDYQLDALVTAGSATLYLDDEASDIGGYETANLSPVARTEDSDALVTAAGAAPVSQAGDSYATPAGGLGVTEIPVGVWTWLVYAGVSSTSDSTALLDCEVYKRSAAGVETLLFTLTTPALGTTVQAYEVTHTVAAPIALVATDRLVLKIVARRTVGASARTVTYYYNGSARYSHMHTTLAGLGIFPAGSAGDDLCLTASRTPASRTPAVARAAHDATRRTVLTLATPPWTLVAGAGGAPAPAAPLVVDVSDVTWDDLEEV